MNEDVCNSQKLTSSTEVPDTKEQSGYETPRHKAALERHDRKCAICNHPERNEIEAAFLDWGRPAQLTRDFSLGHRTVVYRHAHALGLFKKRAENAGFALGLLIEQSSVIKPTANQIISAVRAYSCLDQNGKWTDPPRRLIVTHLDAKGDEIPADKVDPNWRSDAAGRPDTIATKEALDAEAALAAKEEKRRRKR